MGEYDIHIEFDRNVRQETTTIIFIDDDGKKHPVAHDFIGAVDEMNRLLRMTGF
jgi:hypothetical protein